MGTDEVEESRREREREREMENNTMIYIEREVHTVNQMKQSESYRMESTNGRERKRCMVEEEYQHHDGCWC